MSHPVDKLAGQKLRMRRKLLDLTQQDLADAVGVTFQQVQKYEKGANRIGAGRLFTIASILDVPVQFFFEDMPKDVAVGLADVPKAKKKTDETDYVMSIVGSREGLELNVAFSKIDSAATRQAFVALVKTLA